MKSILAIVTLAICVSANAADRQSCNWDLLSFVDTPEVSVDQAVERQIQSVLKPEIEHARQMGHHGIVVEINPYWTFTHDFQFRVKKDSYANAIGFSDPEFRSEPTASVGLMLDFCKREKLNCDLMIYIPNWPNGMWKLKYDLETKKWVDGENGERYFPTQQKRVADLNRLYYREHSTYDLVIHWD
jgi:hypothetical protein